MAKKTYTLNLNGATNGEGVLPGPNPPAGFGFDVDAAAIESKLNANMAGGFSGWVVSGTGPFQIEQPEECGDYALAVLPGTLDVSPSLTVTQEWTPTVNLSVDDNAISEPGDIAVVAFAIAATHSAAVTIEFSMGGTANNPADYTKSANSPLEIASGSSTNTMSITIVDDAAFEVDETITVTLGAITGGEIGTSSVISITLSSNDAASGSAKNMLLMGVG